MISFLGGGGTDSAQDAYEEEMVRVVTEMSLMDDFDLEFDPSRLDIVADKLQLYQDLVDQHLTTADNICLNGFDEPISDAQIKDIFGIDTAAPAYSTAADPAAAPPGDPGEADFVDGADGADDDLHGEELSLGGFESRGPTSELSAAARDVSHKRRLTSESLANSNNIQNLVTTIGGKLRWYQKKIVDQISGTTTADQLKLLLELNDQIAAILTKVSLIVDAEFPAAANDTPPASGITRRDSFAGEPDPSRESGTNSNSNSNSSRDQETAGSDPSHTAVIAAVFALRRGGDRDDTLLAVNNLIKLCHYGGEINKYAAKVMMSAGALQSLLSTLTRSGEWPEVEQQISKLVSVLIVFEDDWVLLQRSALLILSSLYTLRIKTAQQYQLQPNHPSGEPHSGYVSSNSSVRTPAQNISSRSRSRNTSISTTGTTIGCHGALNAAKPTLRDVNFILRSGRLESNLEATKRITRNEMQAPQCGSGSTTGSGNLPATTTATATTATATVSAGAGAVGAGAVGVGVSAVAVPGEHEILIRGGDDEHWSLIDENDDSPDFTYEEEEDIKTLLSAAIAKLTLVLASEWGKLEAPISSAVEKVTLGLDRGHTGRPDRDLFGGSRVHGDDVMSIYGALGMSSAQNANAANRKNGGAGSATQRHSWGGAKKNNLEDDKILQILLNMISSLCESSLEQEPNTNGANSLAGVALTKSSLGGIAASRHSQHNKSFSNMSVVSSNSSAVSSSLAGVDIIDSSVVSVQNSLNTVTTDGKQTATTSSKRVKVNSFRSKSHPSLESGAQPNALTNAAAAAVGNVSGAIPPSNGTLTLSGLPPLMVPTKVLADLQLSDDDDVDNTPADHIADSQVSGLIGDSSLLKVDSSAVLCSAAVANLAAVPQCRPGLVSYGALSMIKAWLQIGMEVLSQAKELCFDLLSEREAAEREEYGEEQAPAADGERSPSTPQPRPLPGRYVEFMESYGPAYELISNAAEALMYISGGSDCRCVPLNASGASADPSDRNQDYIIGWIDAQILSEGLPAVVVKMLQISLEPFTSLTGEKGERKTTRRSRSVLPAAAGMHLAQTLYQICSRPGNRQQLQLIDIPFYLCILFENITSRIDSITKDPTSPANQPRDANISESIFSYIFHFGGIYSQTQPSAAAGAAAATGSEANTNKTSGATPSTSSSKNAAAPFTREASSDFLALYSANVEERQQHRQNMGGGTPLHLRGAYGSGQQQQQQQQRAGDDRTGTKDHPSTRDAGYGKGYSSSCGKGHTTPPPLFNKLRQQDLMPIMESVTSSCLDALTYFFADELAKMPSDAEGLGPAGGYLSAVDDVGLKAGLLVARMRTGGRAAHWMSGLMGHRVPLLDLMCSTIMIDAILISCGFLPRGPGRLSALRLISALTNCPATLRALYDSAVMGALVHIASESEENQRDASQLHPHHKTAVGSNKDSRSSRDFSNLSNEGAHQAAPHGNSQNPTATANADTILAPTSLIASIFPPKPTTVERGFSDGSSVSAMSSSITATGALGGQVSPHVGVDRTESDELHPVMEQRRLLNRIALEETLTVCFALANLCESSEEYALRMFQTGLYSIMLKIVRSRHVEVCRQALRCLEAMCATITNSVLERAVFTDMKCKDGLMLDSLEVLTELLDSPSTPVLRGTISIIAYIAGINETLQDRVVDGPLKVVLYLLLDPAYHRDFRGPAERVLRNLGFPGGEQDYELCGFDFEMLRDWYIMKRSLKPQEMAYEIVADWVEKLFSEQDGTNFEDLQYEVGDKGSQGHDLFDEAAHILQGSFSVGDLPSMAENDIKGSSSIGNLLAGAGAMAGGRNSGLSIPTLQRNITDGLLRLLPFCIKSPFNEAQKTGGSSDWDKSSHAHSTMNMSSHSQHMQSPVSGGATINRSTHGGAGSFSSPAANLPQQRQYDWIDRPPTGVLRLLDLFYTSKLQQLLLMDLTSLGAAIAGPEADAVYEYDTDVDDYFNDDDLLFMIPRPLPISAIIMPSRIYTSFSRVGRVLEKMFAYGDALRMWSLTFRDSEFMGDFHTSLLTTLRRCPQICSLSFASSRCVEDDALMGHLVGQIPASVRFLSFKSTISRESIQALCILLRMHNAAFVQGDGDSMVGGPGGVGRSLSKRSSSLNSSHGKAHSYPAQNAKSLAKDSLAEATAVNLNNARGSPRRGLLGLALTHLTFETSEINYIMELLQCVPRPSVSRHQSFKERNSEPSHHSASTTSMKQAGTPSTAAAAPIGSSSGGGVCTPSPAVRTETSTSEHSNGSNASGSGQRSALATSAAAAGAGGAATAASAGGNPETPRASDRSVGGSWLHGVESSAGLRFLDLSFNALSDQTCAKIILAASQGPLEGLELAGNPLQRCPIFTEAMEIFTMDYMMDHRHRLRHLGLSHCTLNSRTVGAMLEHLLDNVSLTSLDLSHNDIDSSPPSNDMLRHFLRMNCGLRALDLCHNRLQPESYKEMHLGLLENETLLLMPLAGNVGTERNQTIQLIQMKLRQNRIAYQARCKCDDAAIPQTVAFAADGETEIIEQFSIAATAAAEVAAANQRFGRRFNGPIGKEPATAVSAPPNSSAPVVPVDSYELEAAGQPASSGDGLLHSSARADSQTKSHTPAADSNVLSDITSIDSGTINSMNSSSVANATVDTASIAVAAPVVSDGKAAAESTAAIGGDATHTAHDSKQQATGATVATAAVVAAGGIAADRRRSYTTDSSTDRSSKRDSYYALTESDRASTVSLDAWSVRMKQRKGISPGAGSSTPGSAASAAAAAGAAMAAAASEAAEQISGTPTAPSVGTAAAPAKPPSQSMDAPERASFAGTTSDGDSAAVGSSGGRAAARPLSMSAISGLPQALAAHGLTNLPASPTADGGRFSDNTLNVLFSAPLVGFDRASNPHPLEVLDYSSERDILIQVFKEVHRDVSVHFDFATTDALRTALSLGCKALHFSGHGIPKGLCFEDGRSGLQVIRVPQLKDLLGAGGLHLQFVFVSACYSMEVGEAFVRAGVPHVVCVKLDSKVQDSAAIAFTRAFYVAFLSGKTVQASFTIAKEALKASPYVPDRLLEGEKFLLLPDYSGVLDSDAAGQSMPIAAPIVADAAATTATTATKSLEWRIATVAGNHEKVLFKGRPIAKWPVTGKHCTMGRGRVDVQKFLAQNRLPSPPSEFEGREVAMHSLVRAVLERRLVSLVGADGIGKTSVAAATCKILTDRECFPDSVAFVKCEGLHSYDAFLRAFQQALLSTAPPALAAQMQELHQALNQQQQAHHTAGEEGKTTLSSSSSTGNESSGLRPVLMRSGRTSMLNSEEDIVFSCLGDCKMLVVLDNLHDLLADFGEAHTDVRLFLNRLFDLCRSVKVMVVSTDTLSMYNITIGFNVVEYSVPLGLLTLFSSLRLFARLAPCLHTVQSKQEFINALLPPKQRHVTVDSIDASPAAKQILAMFGNGHPKKIVHMASVSTAASVEQLKQAGAHIISHGGIMHTSMTTPSVFTGYSVNSFA